MIMKVIDAIQKLSPRHMSFLQGCACVYDKGLGGGLGKQFHLLSSPNFDGSDVQIWHDPVFAFDDGEVHIPFTSVLELTTLLRKWIEAQLPPLSRAKKRRLRSQKHNC